VGAVLKNNLVESMNAKISIFNVTDIREEADRMIRHAADEARTLKAQADEALKLAQAQAVEIKLAAQKQGFDEGYTLGLEEGKKQGSETAYADTFAQAKKDFTAQIQQVQTALSASLEKFEAERDQMIIAAQQELLALALAVAVKVTHKQFEVDPSVVAENVKAAIGLVASRTSAILRMNPGDMDKFENLNADKLKELYNLRHVRMVKDDAVDAGGCIVQSDNGQIDAQLVTQIESIIAHLAPAMTDTIRRWTSPQAQTIVPETQVQTQTPAPIQTQNSTDHKSSEQKSAAEIADTSVTPDASAPANLPTEAKESDKQA
jgi:flagellar assembly protein FliH